MIQGPAATASSVIYFLVLQRFPLAGAGRGGGRGDGEGHSTRGSGRGAPGTGQRRIYGNLAALHVGKLLLC